MYSKVFLMCAFLFLTTLSEATPPQELDAKYDVKNKTLTVSFKHTSIKLDKHFIRKVEIWSEGSEKLAEYYTRQPAPHQFEYTYDLDLTPGSVVTVKAQCALGGSKEIQIAVPRDEEIVEEKNDTSEAAVLMPATTEIKHTGY